MRFEQCGDERPSRLYEDRRDAAALGQQPHRPPGGDSAVQFGHHDHFRRGGGERGPPIVWGVFSDQHQGVSWQLAADQVGRRRRASLAVEHDPQRLTAEERLELFAQCRRKRFRSDGQAGIIREDRAYTHQHGVTQRPEARGACPRRLAGNPERGAGAGGNFPVEGHRPLDRDERQPGGDELEVALIEMLGLPLVFAQHRMDAGPV